MASDRDRSKAAGFRHHLVKPMGLEQLETILDEAANELHDGDRDDTGGAELRSRGAL